MNHFLDAFKRYADFTGRATRTQFWMFILFCLIFSVLFSVLDTLLGVSIFSLLFGLVTIIPSFSVGARRLHDTGRSGWWQLLYIVPIIGFIVLIVFMVMDSTPGSNEYGENPKEVSV